MISLNSDNLIPKGKIETGMITKYDQKTMTAVVQSNFGVIHNVVCLFDRYDPKNGAFSFTAPSENAPCLFTTIDGTTYLLGMFSPRNMTPDHLHPKSDCSNTESRVPTGAQPAQYENLNPGNHFDGNANGSVETFTDTEKKTVIAPDKLSSIWNILNFIWTNICQIFRLYSGPMDVTAEVTESEECNTTIKWRKTLDERPDGSTTMLDLRLGKDAGIVELKVNGSPLLHIYENKDILLIANNIKINAKKIEYNADEVNMLNVDVVRLP